MRDPHTGASSPVVTRPRPWPPYVPTSSAPAAPPHRVPARLRLAALRSWATARRRAGRAPTGVLPAPATGAPPSRGWPLALRAQVASHWRPALLVGAAGLAFAAEWRRGAVVLEALQVSPQLEARGYTSRILTDLLLDRIRHIRSEAATTARVRDYVGAPEAVPDVEIPTTGVTVRAALQYALELFGRRATTISGDVVMDRAGPYVVVRTSNGAAARLPLDSLRVESAMTDAAAAAVRLTSPYLLVAYRYKQGDAEGARREAQAILAQPRSRDHAYAHNMLGRLLLDARRPEPARAHFAEAVAIDPTYGSPYVGLASVLIGRGDTALYPAAERQYRLAARDPRVRAVAELGLAKLRARQRRWDESIAHARAALEADPGAVSGYRLWGDALMQLGLPRAAAQQYRQETEHGLPAPLALARAGDALLAARDRGAAYGTFAEIEPAARGSEELTRIVADRYYHLARYHDEERVLVAFLEGGSQLSAGDSKLFVTLGQLRARRGLPDSARAAYARAVALNPADTAAARLLAAAP